MDAEQSVPCCDIENLGRLAGSGYVRRGDARRQGEHGSHVAREFDPHVVVRRERVIGGAAVADQRGHITVFVHHHRMREELGHGSHVGRRILVEQRGGVGRKAIDSLSLGEKAVDGEIVAQHPDALLGTLAQRRDRVRGGCSRSDVGENFEFDGAFEGHRELIGGEGLVDASRVDGDGVGLCSHGQLYLGELRAVPTRHQPTRHEARDAISSRRVKSGRIESSRVATSFRSTPYCSTSVVEPVGLKFHCCRTISLAEPSEADRHRRVNSWVRSDSGSWKRS